MFKDNIEQKVIIVMPAYNAAKTLEKTVKDIPPGVMEEASEINVKNSITYGLGTPSDIG